MRFVVAPLIVAALLLAGRHGAGAAPRWTAAKASRCRTRSISFARS